MAWTYLSHVIGLLAVPAVVLTWLLRHELHPRTHVASIAVITALGSIWSHTLSATGWWTFSLDYRSGITLGPHLLLEEFLFYPFGGAMSLLLYTLGRRLPAPAMPRVYLATVWGGTALFAVAAWAAGPPVPWYLVSLLVLYSGVVTLPLSGLVASRVHVGGWLLSVAGMGLIGWIWDVFAVQHGWWTYHAGTHWLVLGAPFDDLHFFLFAPTAAVTVQLALAPVLERSPVPSPTAAGEVA